MTINNKELNNRTIMCRSINGKQVEILLDQKMNTGKHEIVWDASVLPGGIYIYRILSGYASMSDKVIVNH